MAWPIDNIKLDGVRSLMKDQDLSALVVRAPDNVLYLTNYWCMKGYDAAIFPREGDPTLIAIAPQQEDAERTSWTSDIRYFKGYDDRDPRPPTGPARLCDARPEKSRKSDISDRTADPAWPTHGPALVLPGGRHR